MPKVTLRPTILADLPHVIGEPLPCRIRAITALVDGRIIGMGGIAFPLQGPAIAFAQLVPAPSNGVAGRDGGAVWPDDRAAESIPEARRYPVAFHRAGLMTMEMIRTSGARQVIATADAGSAIAVRWLKRLGFRPADDQRIEGKLLFVWNRGDVVDGRRNASPAPHTPTPVGCDAFNHVPTSPPGSSRRPRTSRHGAK